PPRRPSTPSSVPARRSCRRESRPPNAASSSSCASPRTASPAARPRCCTTATRSSARARFARFRTKSAANRQDPARMGDRISLTVPRARNYFGVAHLVLGGVAMRQNFTLEALEDLQVALEEILERERGDGQVTLELELTDGSLRARVGPVLCSGARAGTQP